MIGFVEPQPVRVTLEPENALHDPAAPDESDADSNCKETPENPVTSMTMTQPTQPDCAEPGNVEPFGNPLVGARPVAVKLKGNEQSAVILTVD